MPDTPRPDTMVASVALFNLGTLVNDQSALTYRRGIGTKVEVPVTSAFIEMQDGEHILFDTGMLPHGEDGMPAQHREIIARYAPEDDIRARLGEIGRTPDDVAIVV